MSFEKVIAAWREAVDDLQIEIQSPFLLTTADSNTISFELLVKNFGSKLGTIVLLIDDMIESKIPAEYGYYCSALNPETYATYERQHFIDTLNDWGFFGEQSEKPDWYTGQPWG